jgi:hypothetical protein
MRLIDLAGLYALVGVACAVVIVRRSGSLTRERALDATLSLVVWPLYVPALLSPMPPPRALVGLVDPAIAREHALLLRAVASVTEPAVATLLPSAPQLARLATEMTTLDAKVRELTEVLSHPDFDDARAKRLVAEAERDGGPALSHAKQVRGSIERLSRMRARAAHDRDELLSLCQRLRIELTVLRFAGSAPADVGDVVGEMLARLEGVGAAFGDACETEGSPRDHAA